MCITRSKCVEKNAAENLRGRAGIRGCIFEIKGLGGLTGVCTEKPVNIIELTAMRRRARGIAVKPRVCRFSVRLFPPYGK